MPASEPEAEQPRLLSSQARAASPARSRRRPWPSVPPGRTSVDGVPNSFHATSARIAFASARWAAVGAMWSGADVEVRQAG